MRESNTTYGLRGRFVLFRAADLAKPDKARFHPREESRMADETPLVSNADEASESESCAKELTH